MELFYSSSFALLAPELARFPVAQEAPLPVPAEPVCHADVVTSQITSRVLRFTICHKTEVIKNNLNPVWQPFTIPVRALCNGDYDR